MSQVSIVIPIYNAEKKLDKCIHSILNQTFEDLELILVNDGSSDSSLNICRKYERQDKRIIVINKKNEGSITTRKKGIEASSSDYVMFVDADDWIDRRMVEILYKQSVESSADITVCNTYKVLGNGVLIKKKNKSEYFDNNRIYDKEGIRKELVVAYFWGHPFPSSLYAKLYKREILESCGEYLNKIHFLGDDLFYNLEMFIKSNRITIIDQALYYYRMGGLTSKYMPYLFEDMVNGYQIQKEVINKYYLDTQQKQYNGISIMLLNTFKTCLYNLFNSNLGEMHIRELIEKYVSNEKVIECLHNEGSRDYFSKEYLDAIKYKNVDYLYALGEKMYRKGKIKRVIKNIIAKLPVI
ncbi:MULTISPECIES: glycosyltransferase family 2 protein [Bacillus]|uniref:Glycosyl transferase family protein n=1 Tax=Bacillus cereus TaxID=1396 RepID=A0A161T7M7_BACCE|nr:MULTISPECIES: glycosyltransferase family 2 protein [Bacillus]KZD68359.1 Glycosyl transferase family protein [Bacillus cereus]TSI02846.1 glycosyltransferase family 2 protein [Bacillus sp. HY001]